MKKLTEKEAEEFLEKNGLKVVKREFIKKQTQLKGIKIKFPWVMKISSTKIAHKASLGGVITNIRNLK